jgi:hypothetical protein
LPVNQVLIGHPSAAAKEAEREPRSLLNLFFYRIEPGAYAADAASADPFYIRAYCLITALADAETDPATHSTVSAGEGDLRLIGGVMQLLHEQPFIRLRDDQGNEIAQLQVVLTPLGVDAINHIWSTQGETPYRLSVDYELALIPTPLARPVERGPKVGQMRLGAEQAGYTGAAIAAPLSFRVPAARVDPRRPDWAPVIRFVTDDGALQLALAFPRSEVPASLRVAAAGAPGSELAIAWELWDRASGWRELSAGTPQTLSVSDPVLDPDGPSPHAVAVLLPLASPGQALVYATRPWTRPDGTVLSLRSNPLLVSVYEDATP